MSRRFSFPISQCNTPFLLPLLLPEFHASFSSSSSSFLLCLSLSPFVRSITLTHSFFSFFIYFITLLLFVFYLPVPLLSQPHSTSLLSLINPTPTFSLSPHLLLIFLVKVWNLPQHIQKPFFQKYSKAILNPPFLLKYNVSTLYEQSMGCTIFSYLVALVFGKTTYACTFT